MSRLSELLAAVAARVSATGMPCRVISGAPDVETLQRMLLPAAPRGAAAVALLGWDATGAVDGEQEIRADLVLYVAAYDEAGAAPAIIDRVERFAGLIHGQTWGCDTAWIAPAELPKATNQYASPRDASGPGGASVWLLRWRQSLSIRTTP